MKCTCSSGYSKARILVLAVMILLPYFIVEASEGDRVTVVTKALAVSTGSFYRTTLLTIDPIEASLIKGVFREPEAGTLLTLTDGKQVAWEEIAAGEDGWFKDNKALQGGYVYVRLNSDREKTIILEGMSHQMVYINGVPRVGNRYQYKEDFASWEPQFNFSLMPVRLKKGANDLLFRCNRGRLKIKIHETAKGLLLNTHDLTLPDMIAGETLDDKAAVVVVNTTDQVQDELYITASWEGGKTTTTPLPDIRPGTVRKVAFTLEGKAPQDPGEMPVHLVLFSSSHKVKIIQDQQDITLRVINADKPQKHTFISNIDGSVQYYAINPALQGKPGEEKALVLSVHGAGVEAINQAASYYPKSWVNIVCPTNRRPYGFDWEDWGRLDALEVLELAESKYPTQNDRVYLTGHSMGGHGTWILGAQYPDRFGAIGPSAGWISWWSYRVRGEEKENDPMTQMLRSAALPSNTYALMHNYSQLGIYIIHGSKDDNVPPQQSYQMVDSLKTFHHDFVFHEQPGAGHWWDVSDEPGADCVDWPPLFDFFARHARPWEESVRIIDFTTPNPGISSKDHWLEIEQQQIPLTVSHVHLQYDPGKNRFSGTTKNIARLAIDLKRVDTTRAVTVSLDSSQLKVSAFQGDGKLYLCSVQGEWQVTGPLNQMDKNPDRYGTFKDAFRHHMIFVVGTKGNKKENEWAASKARYDAETFWYQGNGSVDIIEDTDFTPEKYKDRSVILYGNASTNCAWRLLLDNCPVKVTRKEVIFDGRHYKGDNLAVLFTWPRKDSKIASVAVVSGTGIQGMRLTNNRPYMYAGFAVPDVLVFTTEIISNGNSGVVIAGYFGNDWSVKNGNFVKQ